MATATLKDIARISGVSVATVDRVLHGRSQSRPETIERVHQAIEDIGYRPNLAASRLSRGKEWRIGILLPSSNVGFLEWLVSKVPELDAYFKEMGVSIVLDRANPEDPLAFAKKLDEFARDLDACAILAPNDPAVVEVAKQLENGGVRIATLISDLPTAPRSFFAGPDNGAMGATAAQLAIPLMRRTEGLAVVLKPPALQEDHEARFIGFSRTLLSCGIDGTRIRSLVNPETREISALTETLTAGLRGSIIDVIYMTGGRIEPLVEAIETLDVNQPMIVGTDLTPASSKLLIERRLDAVVASDALGEMKDAIRGLLRKLTEPLLQQGKMTRPIQIFTRFNIPVR